VTVSSITQKDVDEFSPVLGIIRRNSN